jgi:hypothetical protein
MFSNTLSEKQTKSKKIEGRGSSKKMLAYQAQGLKFNPQYHQKIK